MKVAAIIATARKNGNVAQLAGQVLKGAEAGGHETALLNLYDYEIKHCVGCWQCAKGSCVLRDDFPSVMARIEDADVVILGAPVYWGNIPGVMKAFFDRHTAVMEKPPDAADFCRLPTRLKIKAMLDQLKTFGPRRPLRGKRYIIVTACTVPTFFGYLKKDLSGALLALKIYIGKMCGKPAGRIIYGDTLFRLNPRRKDRLMQKAYALGKRLA